MFWRSFSFACVHTLLKQGFRSQTSRLVSVGHRVQARGQESLERQTVGRSSPLMNRVWVSRGIRTKPYGPHFLTDDTAFEVAGSYCYNLTLKKTPHLLSSDFMMIKNLKSISLSVKVALIETNALLAALPQALPAHAASLDATTVSPFTAVATER